MKLEYKGFKTGIGNTGNEIFENSWNKHREYFLISINNDELENIKSFVFSIFMDGYLDGLEKTRNIQKKQKMFF